MSKSYKITHNYEDNINFDDDEDDYWPEDVPKNHAWHQSCRDWIGEGPLDGIEGTMGITVSYYGVTEEQKNLIESVMLEFGSEARTLFQQLIDKRFSKTRSN